jgi:ABC-type Fe3+ transport system substrate-binding protein
MKKAFAFILALLWPLAAAAQVDSQLPWDEVLAAARKEGKVVVLGPPTTEMRRDMPAAFKARYGITMEYIGGRTAEVVSRMRAERQAGINSFDSVLSGMDSMAGVFYKEKMLEPLRPALMLPEVLDGSKWKRGKLWFSDPDDRYILRLANSVSNMFHVNTKEVSLDELRSAQDLLNPKWKGRIALEDPTVTGSGSNHAAHLYLQLGGDFIKKLYIDQKPMISRDTRVLTDGLIRGIYPITLGAEDAVVDKMRKEGMPLALLQGFSDLYLETSSGYGQLGIINNAQHPNAAKVFANWMASKEGSELYARARGAAPTRGDIDESFLPPEVIPRDGVKYFDNHDWEYTVTKKEEARQALKEISKAR